MQLRHAILTATLGAMLLGAGCTHFQAPTGVTPQTTLSRAVLDADPVTDTWDLVASDPVLPGLSTIVQGSRYTLTFDPLSLLSALTVTIRERNSNIVDVDLGPEGTRFLRPVTFQINYRGTANDPASPNYNGLPPRLYWFNPVMNSWIVVPGTDDPKNCLYTVQLQHFSRYAMGDGTSGWEDADNSGHPKGSVN